MLVTPRTFIFACQATPAKSQKKKKKKKKKRADTSGAASEASAASATSATKSVPAKLKGLLKTPETPRRSARLNRRVSWGEDQIRSKCFRMFYTHDSCVFPTSLWDTPCFYFRCMQISLTKIIFPLLFISYRIQENASAKLRWAQKAE